MSVKIHNHILLQVFTAIFNQVKVNTRDHVLSVSNKRNMVGSSNDSGHLHFPLL